MQYYGRPVSTVGQRMMKPTLSRHFFGAFRPSGEVSANPIPTHNSPIIVEFFFPPVHAYTLFTWLKIHRNLRSLGIYVRKYAAILRKLQTNKQKYN